MDQEPLPCWVYKSPRKAEMYLYLAREADFDSVPPALLERFGQPMLVMQLMLHPARRLAREDPLQVMANLRVQGFHLQLPERLDADLYHGNLC